jgi:hypothetical protein
LLIDGRHRKIALDVPARCPVSGHAGVLMVTSHGEVDMSSPSGAMIASITSAVAVYESAVKRERLLRMHERIAAEGRRSGGGSRPYGYTDGSPSTVVEAEARVIREVARRLLAGCSIAGEVERLNAEGIPTVSGKPWTRTTLSRMMRSGRISGRREHRGEITAAGGWPAIISPTDSDRLRTIHDTQRHRRYASRRYLLSGGIARCGNCGAALVARPKQDGRRGYFCATIHGGCNKLGILAEDFEAFVVEAAITAVDSGRLAALAGGPGSDPALAAARLRSVDERQATLAADFASGLLPAEAYRAGLDALAADRRQTRRLLLPRRSALAELTEVTAPDPLAGLDGPLRAAWPALDLSQRRAIVERMLADVTVAPAVKGRNRFDPERVSSGPALAGLTHHPAGSPRRRRSSTFVDERKPRSAPSQGEGSGTAVEATEAAAPQRTTRRCEDGGLTRVTGSTARTTH